MILKVLVILMFYFYQNICANINQQTPSHLSLYRYEGNFYPVYVPKPLNLKLNTFQGNTKPSGITRYLQPVHLSHQIYHHANYENQVSRDDATGSEYQVAMKVQPLQQVISSGKRIESGKSHQGEKLKIDTMLPDQMQQLFHHNQNGVYDQSSDRSRMDSGPNKPDTITRHYHDILLKYKTPQDLVFGHVLNWPQLAKKSIEKRDRNRFKGQVIWADKTGGFGEHYWDLAQGTL